jgi:hypothetical protein
MVEYAGWAMSYQAIERLRPFREAVATWIASAINGATFAVIAFGFGAPWWGWRAVFVVVFFIAWNAIRKARDRST